MTTKAKEQRTPRTEILTITKRSGRTEEFRRGKLERSLRAAGASDQVIREIVSELSHRPGVSTEELRTQVLSQLRGRDPASAHRYELARTFRPQARAEIDEESIHLHPEILRRLGCEAGMALRLEHDGHSLYLRAEASSRAPSDRVWVHPRALQFLGVPAGAKVALWGDRS
jgi:hypothetical protein